MIRIRNHGPIPRSRNNGPVFGVITRNTLFGFHKRTQIENFDAECSKTVLIMADTQKIAETITEQLQREIKYGYSWNRLVHNNTILREREPTSSLFPLMVEQFDLNDMQKICWMHHFDMYVIHNLSYENDIMYMDTYEFHTYELPNRGMVEKYMYDMLYKT